MRTNGTRMPWVGAAAAVLALTLGPGPATRAGEEPGGREGIKVHGDWTIELRNKDGSLASRHEFKNALTSYGAVSLAAVLAGLQTACGWLIAAEVLGGVGADRECRQNGGCLSLIVTDTGLTLRGRLEPEASSWVIRSVRTNRSSIFGPGGQCGPTPLDYSRERAFTQRTLNPPIEVQPEQSVDVKVVFTFS